MGKISDALEKAGLDEGKDSGDQPEKLLAETPAEELPASQTSSKLHEISESVKRVDMSSEQAGMPAEKVDRSVEEVGDRPVQQAERDEPVPESAWDERFLKAVKEDDYLPEIFKTLRARILLPGDGKPVPKTIMVTSVEPKEGKSFIAANLGVSLAQGVDQHCLLVSCDLRRPSLSSLFGLDGSYGLVDYLRDQKEISTLIQKTAVEKLSLIASGKPPENPSELLGSSRMRDLVLELSKRYDDRIIIFDCPPYQLAAESAVLAKLVDSIVVVVRQGGAGRHQVKKLLEKIPQDQLLGVVFNGHTTNLLERSLMRA